MAIDNEKLIEFATEIQGLMDNMNVGNLLDTVYVNENVHSRILRMILHYVEDSHYPFYESFLKTPKIEAIIPSGTTGKPSFFNERGRIDLLIEGRDYAIIIENKIYDADDQKTQLERYLDKCVEQGISSDRLFAVYLTKDGSKEVSPSSLTVRARKILGMSDGASGRFAEMNFRDDILPWVKGLIVQSRGNESRELIKSALTQYADFLSNMFGQGENETKFNNHMEKLLRNFNINTVSSFTQHIDALSSLSGELIKRRNQYCSQLASSFVSQPLKDYCMERNLEIKSEQYAYGQVAIRINIPACEKAFFYIDTESGKLYYGLGNFNSNDGLELSPNALCGFKERGYAQSPWSPAYKHPKGPAAKFAFPASVEFWEDAIPDGFAKFVIDSYEEVESVLAL